MTTDFPSEPSITVFDPLAELLGAGDGHFSYTFSDVVRLSGHACPTVAGAFLMACHGLQALYGEAVPERGGVRVSLPGKVDEGVNGPMSQVFTLLTGAAAENGFHGLAGAYGRDYLLTFLPEMAGEGYLFQRIDRGDTVRVRYDASPIPADPAMGPLMQQVLQGDADDQERKAFQLLWRERVMRILEDGGKQTVRVEKIG